MAGLLFYGYFMAEQPKESDLIEDLKQQVITVFNHKLNTNGLITKEVIELSAIEIAEKIRSLWQGQQCYVSKGFEERNKQIIAKYTGRNIRQLAREFDISESHIRNIVKKAMKKNQADIFIE
jgi:Mor family transcriptional regulator